MAGPYHLPGAEAYAVPHDVKMLATVFDVLDDDALVMAAGITVLLFKALADTEHLFIGQPFILHWIDADMVQRLLARVVLPSLGKRCE
jgi:hypothetical protein